MVTGGYESVLIGGPVDGDDDIVGSGVGVAATGSGTDIFGFGSDEFLVSALFHSCTVLAFVAEDDSLKKINYG